MVRVVLAKLLVTVAMAMRGRTMIGGYQEQVVEEAGYVCEGVEAGFDEEQAVRDEEGEIEEGEEEEGFGGEEFLPLVGAGEPELAVAYERFGLDEAGDEDPPAHGNEEEQELRRLAGARSLKVPAVPRCGDRYGRGLR